MTPSIEERIRDFLVREFSAEHAIDANESLIAQGIVDSVGILQLVTFIERDFAITVNPEDLVLRNFESIRSMRELINSKLQQR